MANPEVTNYEVGQDNIRPFGLDIHNPVFVISSVTIIAFVLMTLAFQAEAAEFFGWLRTYLTYTFAWIFIRSANIFVVFSLLLVVTPMGSIQPGGPAANPESSFTPGFALHLAAGLGSGLLSWDACL